ncbi:MAG TPA: glycosyltransferase family 39 protein [Solirubrobacteraceae bacterium]
MSAATPSPAGGTRAAALRGHALGAWWALAGLVVLAAALRFSTLGLQSLWYDEAFTPVHTLHPGLTATLSAVAHTENSPPLWYLLEWAVSRVFGTGAIALRSLSALAGVASVVVGWGIGRELAGRRAAFATAALTAVNPLFVWYSQEARAYGLYTLMAALAVLCFLRALREPTPVRLTAFAVSGALALLTHYFAVFLLAPMCLWLVLEHRAHRRMTLAAVAAVGAVGVALLPLISAQGGRGTQWIGRWPLGERLEAIPQYYLTGESGAPLGHGVELLLALPVLGGLFFGLWRGLTRLEERPALIMLVLSACGVLIPVALVIFGLDYLAPRNLVAAMIPLTALLALVIAAQRTGRVGIALVGVIALAFLAMSVDVNLSPRLQRGDWRGVAKVLHGTPANDRVITTVELGAAPLEYYLPPLHNLARGRAVTVSEIDETGYAPLRASAGSPPAPGFHLLNRYDVNGLIVYRFVSDMPRMVSESALRRHVITEAHPEVLVSPAQAPL